MKIYSTGEVCNKEGDSDPTKCYNLDPGTENRDLIHPLVHREITEQSSITIRLSLSIFRYINEVDHSLLHFFTEVQRSCETKSSAVMINNLSKFLEVVGNFGYFQLI